MSLRTEFENRGSWLFRHRSFLALSGVPLLIAGLTSFSYVGRSHASDEVWNLVCLIVSLTGLAIRVLTVAHVPQGTSGRNTQQQLAETLNTSGVYSVVRHPLYLGNYVMVLGVALFFHTWWIVALATCLCVLFYERIMFAEESFLRTRFGNEFEDWAAVTPAVIPNFRLWRRSRLPFSWRNVLRREYTGLFVLTSTFAFLDTTGDSIADGKMHVDLFWVIVAGLGAVVYLTLRSLKKQTHLLDEALR